MKPQSTDVSTARRRVLLAAAGMPLLAACGGGDSAPAPDPSAVPAVWQPLYASLAAQLDAVDAYWSARPAQPGAVSFSASLLSANTNAGRRLLETDAVASSLVLADALLALGVREVNIDIQLPFVLPVFGADYIGYRNFYVQLMAALRLRGMRASIELGTTFNEGGFSDVVYDYRTRTFAQYRDDLREQAIWIASALVPDSLVLGNEPDTQSRNTGFALTPAVWAEAIGNAARGARAAAPAVPLYAGTGTWNTAGYVDALLALPELDGIDLHLYPLHNDWGTGAIDASAQKVRSAGRRLRFSEAWLYKAAANELNQGIASAADIFKRDVFSFWQPLDIRFLQTCARLAHGSGAHAFNFFWTTYLFGNVDYDPALDALSYTELARRAVAAASANILARNPNALGRALAQIAAAK